MFKSTSTRAIAGAALSINVVPAINTAAAVRYFFMIRLLE
jgi:hypothetical protein